MSLEDIRSECSEVAALLQPYVDGELDDPEAVRVATHLEGCSACRTAVSEQLWVRATLRAIDPEPAPVNLRQRVLGALDEVDAEVDAQAHSTSGTQVPATASASSGNARPLRRLAKVALPLAAVAAGAVLMLREQLQPLQSANKLPLAELSAAGAQAVAPKAAPKPLASTRKAALKVAPAPGQVQLVGAQLDPVHTNPKGARLRYRVSPASGQARHIIDRQRPAGVETPIGTVVNFRGQQYRVARGQMGQPTVRFDRAGVTHVVTLEEARMVGADVDPPDFSELLDIAHQIAAGP